MPTALGRAVIDALTETRANLASSRQARQPVTATMNEDSGGSPLEQPAFDRAASDNQALSAPEAGTWHKAAPDHSHKEFG